MNVFEQIRQTQPTFKGWCCPEKAEALAAMVISIRPTTSIEVGVHGGSSFLPIAMAHKEIGYGMAWGIDAWDTLASTENELPENVEFWKKINHEEVYKEFMAHVNNLGLGNCTRIIRDRSDNVQSPQEIDLLHIDGSHTQQAVRDVLRFAINVRVGGFCVMDDESWSTGGPKMAVERLLPLGFKRLYPLGTGSVYQRIK